jgi:hypothetical protein
VINVREILKGDTELAAEAMLALRPRWGTPVELTEVIDTRLRPVGYRLLGVFRDRAEHAVARRWVPRSERPGLGPLPLRR